MSILKNFDFSKEYFHSCKYFSLLNTLIGECYSKKLFHEFILIQGIRHKKNIYADQINYDIAQNVNAEVIFIANLKNNSLKCIEEKEKQIKIFLDQKKYKNVLGVLFNNINSPFIEKKYNFIKKLAVLKKYKSEFIKQDFFKNNFFSIIAKIPCNKYFLKVYIKDIYNFLNAKLIGLKEISNHTIEKIIFFDESCIHMLNKNYSKTLIIVSLHQISFFIKMFYLKLTKNKISAIILSDLLAKNKCIASKCHELIYQKVPIFFVRKNIIDIISQLQMFNFNISIKEKTYIQKLQMHISSFFTFPETSSLIKKSKYRTTSSPREFCYFLENLSRNSNKRIIFPESYESRILQAVSICSNLNIAECILLGDPQKIYKIANDHGIKLNKNIEIINPNLIRDNYISRFIELRKNKNVDELSVIKQLEDNIVLATLILESSIVDGLVSGSVNTTANTIRPALQIIKTNTNSSLVSSIFFMLFPNQVLIYGDCAININPTAEELSEIAIQSANSAKMFGIEPRIAMLSYSTGYSGSGSLVEKVRMATAIVKKKRPDLIIDGPIQYDAAISETVAKLKIPNSSILGSSTVFIFPDLNSGNITYKAVQRSTNMVSIGPMLQGLRKPVNDLSRGSSVQDIIYTVALTSIQAT